MSKHVQTCPNYLYKVKGCEGEVFAFLSNAVCRCLVSLLRVAFGCCVRLLASLSHLVSLHSCLIVPLFLSPFLPALRFRAFRAVSAFSSPLFGCLLHVTLLTSCCHLSSRSADASALVSFLPCPLCVGLTACLPSFCHASCVLSSLPCCWLLSQPSPGLSPVAASALLCCVQPSGGVSPFLAPSAFSSPVSGFFHL